MQPYCRVSSSESSYIIMKRERKKLICAPDGTPRKESWSKTVHSFMLIFSFSDTSNPRLYQRENIIQLLTEPLKIRLLIRLSQVFEKVKNSSNMQYSTYIIAPMCALAHTNTHTPNSKWYCHGLKLNCIQLYKLQSTNHFAQKRSALGYHENWCWIWFLYL